MAEYIEREAIYKTIAKNVEVFDGTGSVIKGQCLEHILTSEPADVVEVVHGYWEEVIGDIRCSVCKISQDNGHKHNYCPECGAKMDAERRSEE